MSQPHTAMLSLITYSIEPNSILERGSAPSELVISFSNGLIQKSVTYTLNSENERIDNDGDFAITGLNGRQATVTLDKTKIEEMVYTQFPGSPCRLTMVTLHKEKCLWSG